jgi:tetraacyldisaccharide 4'-kinase
LLPTGGLRESRQGAKRAHTILVTKCPENLSKEAQDFIKQKLLQFHKKVFFTSISYADSLLGSMEIATSKLKNYEVLLITGIANPAPLVNYLKSLNVQFQHLEFPDHHHFSDKEIESIENKFKEMPSSKIIVTTEKDYVRLRDKIQDLSYLSIETTFLNNENEEFNALIKSHLKETV